MIFTVVFRDNKSLIYINKKRKYCDTKELFNKNVKISFHIPFPRAISKYSAYIPLLKIKMSLYSAHIIFYDIIYCSKMSIKKKRIEIQKILEKDKFFYRYNKKSIYEYTKHLSKCKLNKIFNVKW
jgi:hypothetical protein